MELWFDVIKLRDARLLRKWWTNRGRYRRYYIVPSKTNPRFYALVRTEVK